VDTPFLEKPAAIHNNVLQAMTSRTSPTLLAQLADGGAAAAWDEFFRRYWPVMYGYAKVRGCSEDTAEDVVQDVMLRVFEQRDVFRYDPQKGRFRDWLGAVVRNKVAEYRRRPSERARPGGGDLAELVPAEEAAPDAAWDDAFEKTLLMAALDVVRAEVNPRAFLAFELVEIAGVAPARAAAATGLSRNAVYKAARRIMRRLKALAGEYGATGRLPARLRAALALRPGAAVERTLTGRVAASMRGEREPSARE
jgi:RNA polymerase sigma-70 factor (ECF subfamily)